MNRTLDTAALDEWGLFEKSHLCVIAGPCSAESELQVLRTASALKGIGVGVFRAGLWKPRTHPGTFEGVGSEGLQWLERVKRECGLKVCTEVACSAHVHECLEVGVDMVWIGARTTANPFMVQEIAEALKGSDIPVLVKNPVNPDIDLWIGAVERLSREGVRKIGVVHRGFSTFEKTQFRNAPEWRIAVEFRSRYPQIPFFCDPSHIGGKTEYIGELSQTAMDLGLDGLMIECHCDPASALSDAFQQLTPSQLQELLERLVVRDQHSADREYNESVEQLRTHIDVIDGEIINLIASRMDVIREIGLFKKNSNVSIIQASRWDEVMENVLAIARDRGLDQKLVREIFNAIHEASVAEQNKIL